MLGLLVLLLIAAALLVVLMTAMLVYGVLHPSRHTDAYALARGLPTDPGDLGLKHEQWMLDLPDGAMLPVWEIDLGSQPAALNEALSPGNLTVVCVHGWGQAGIDMLVRLEMLRASPHVGQVVLYDLRGHGAAEDATASLAARDHLDLLELLDRLPRTPIVLVGFSMGAIIALRAAAEDAAKQYDLRGVIGIGAYSDFHRALRNQLRQRGYPARPMTDLAMLWLKWFDRIAPQPREYASAVSVPVLLLHGQDDHVATVEDARMLAEVLPDAQLHIMEHAGHLDVHHRMPNEATSLISNFFQQLLRKPRNDGKKHEAQVVIR